MKKYHLKISSKNEKSLKKFSIFFFKHLKTSFNIIQKSIMRCNKKKIVTLLKSPHVNKTAQEHFELCVFSKETSITLFYVDKNLVFLKNNLNRLFQDISVSLEFSVNKDLNYKNKLLTFNPDDFKLAQAGLVKKNIKRVKQKRTSLKKTVLVNYLFIQLLDILSSFSEMFLYSIKKKNIV